MNYKKLYKKYIGKINQYYNIQKGGDVNTCCICTDEFETGQLISCTKISTHNICRGCFFGIFEDSAYESLFNKRILRATGIPCFCIDLDHPNCDGNMNPPYKFVLTPEESKEYDYMISRIAEIKYESTLPPIESKRDQLDNPCDEMMSIMRDILTICICCPHCNTAFMDFSGCLELTCVNEDCKKHFCGVCLHKHENADTDAHRAVDLCMSQLSPEMISKIGAIGRYFIHEAKWPEIIEIKKLKAIVIYLRKNKEITRGCIKKIIDDFKEEALFDEPTLEKFRDILLAKEEKNIIFQRWTEGNYIGFINDYMMDPIIDIDLLDMTDDLDLINLIKSKYTARHDHFGMRDLEIERIVAMPIPVHVIILQQRADQIEREKHRLYNQRLQHKNININTFDPDILSQRTNRRRKHTAISKPNIPFHLGGPPRIPIARQQLAEAERINATKKERFDQKRRIAIEARKQATGIKKELDEKVNYIVSELLKQKQKTFYVLFDKIDVENIIKNIDEKIEIYMNRFIGIFISELEDGKGLHNKIELRNYLLAEIKKKLYKKSPATIIAEEIVSDVKKRGGLIQKFIGEFILNFRQDNSRDPAQTIIDMYERLLNTEVDTALLHLRREREQHAELQRQKAEYKQLYQKAHQDIKHAEAEKNKIERRITEKEEFIRINLKNKEDKLIAAGTGGRPALQRLRDVTLPEHQRLLEELILEHSEAVERLRIATDHLRVYDDRDDDDDDDDDDLDA